jgi:hypothetical protein
MSAEVNIGPAFLALFVVDRGPHDCYWLDRLTGRWEWRGNEPRGYSLAGYSRSMEYEEIEDWDSAGYARKVVCGCWRNAHTRDDPTRSHCVLRYTDKWTLRSDVGCCWS